MRRDGVGVRSTNIPPTEGPTETQLFDVPIQPTALHTSRGSVLLRGNIHAYTVMLIVELQANHLKNTPICWQPA